jgi:hypothetical protein
LEIVLKFRKVADGVKLAWASTNVDALITVIEDFPGQTMTFNAERRLKLENCASEIRKNPSYTNVKTDYGFRSVTSGHTSICSVEMDVGGICKVRIFFGPNAASKVSLVGFI